MLKEANLMVAIKSLEYGKVFAALLCDVQTLHSNVFTSSDLKLTLKKCESRIRKEGFGFLTKTLPRLGKALDRALSESEPLDSAKLAFTSLPNSKLPRFLGELFKTVLAHDGTVLPYADVISVKSLRMLLFCFYKLELPNDPKLEQDVIAKFERTEHDISLHSDVLDVISNLIRDNGVQAYDRIKPESSARLIRKARITLQRVFATFNCSAIFPRHGPGAVSTKETASGKYTWTKVAARITEIYPLDAYFYASIGHFCDSISSLNELSDCESLAKVILVPKDSRGPRLISCEPLDFQWIQQGLSRAIVQLVESHPLTKGKVNFTNQQPNRFAALWGSAEGKYATLDLNEASDRVSVALVRLLFPEPILSALLACRSLGTVLPGGKELTLKKFAPMGSALCFPILALSVWVILDSMDETDEDTRERILVYGDDVIVPAAKAAHAMNALESFGLKINRDKSCTKGFFRESCGLDAYKGIEVTPVRFRTPWSPSRCPESFTSWMAYANSMWERKYYNCYDYIVKGLISVYDGIPLKALGLTTPSLPEVPEQYRAVRRRWNSDLQKFEYRTLTTVPLSVTQEIGGWKMLLRFFSEACSSYELSRQQHPEIIRELVHSESEPFSVRTYTLRKRNKLCYSWS